MQTPILVKLKMKGIYKSLLSIIGILLITASSLLIMYLLYDKVIDNDDDIEVDGNISISYIDGKNFKIASNDAMKFSVSNNGDKISYYNLVFSQIRGTGNYRLLFNDNVVMEGVLNTTNEISLSDISIDAGETKMYQLELSNNGSEDIKGKIQIRVQDSKIVTFAETILKDNPPKDALTEVGVEVAVENEGLIKSTDNLGTSYYFRGNVPNNYVSFANLTWRIVRINGDGTVRLVLNDVANTLTTYYTEEKDDYSYKNSNINTYLKSWEEENLRDYYNYLANTSFCNDMSNDNNNYLNYTRIFTNKIPTLTCLANSFNSSIGILTIDEVVMAGASPTKNNTSFYLYNPNITDMWYTMSGAKKDINNLNMFMFDTDGKIRTDVAGNLYRNVRPVVNIIKNITVSGNGTIENPYVIG